jgi:hypothetical protein
MFQIGLNSTSNRFAVPAAFLTWGWAYAYLMLSSRTPKQWYGLDHQGSPREDLAKYGEAAVRDGKLTRTQLGRIQRLEAASANSIDGYAFFGLSGKIRARNSDFSDSESFQDEELSIRK